MLLKDAWAKRACAAGVIRARAPAKSCARTRAKKSRVELSLGGFRGADPDGPEEQAAPGDPGDGQRAAAHAEAGQSLVALQGCEVPLPLPPRLDELLARVRSGPAEQLQLGTVEATCHELIGAALGELARLLPRQELVAPRFRRLRGRVDPAHPFGRQAQPGGQARRVREHVVARGERPAPTSVKAPASAHHGNGFGIPARLRTHMNATPVPAKSGSIKAMAKSTRPRRTLLNRAP